MRKPRASEWLLAVAMAAMVVAAASGAPAQPRTQQQPQPQAQPAAQPSGPPNALQGFSQNRDQPVNIKADALEVRDRNKIATFTGSVHLVQGDTVLRCKILVVFYDQEDTGAPAVKSATPGPGGSSQIRRMEAKGSVVVTQKDQTATGDTGLFDMKSNTVTMTGNVLVSQGPNVLRGERLVVDLTTGVSRVDAGSSNGPVRMLIQQGAPQPNAQQGAPSPNAQQGGAQPNGSTGSQKFSPQRIY
jgi:lipopolysaccharide export system protein LptA